MVEHVDVLDEAGKIGLATAKIPAKQLNHVRQASSRAMSPGQHPDAITGFQMTEDQLFSDESGTASDGDFHGRNLGWTVSTRKQPYAWQRAACAVVELTNPRGMVAIT